MQRLKDPQIPFEYECTAPLTEKYRIKSHSSAQYLQLKIELWQDCVRNYNDALHAFVALELTQYPELVAEMSPEQKRRYGDVLVKVAQAKLDALARRDMYLALSNQFDKCTSIWTQRVGEFEKAGGERKAVVKDGEYNRMTPERKEGIDYLYGNMITFVHAHRERRNQAADEHYDNQKRLDR